MDLRPDWCLYPDCKVLDFHLNDEGDGMCFGRMSETTKHDSLLNTHHVCFSEYEKWEINDADAYYAMKGCRAIRRDVRNNNLYRPPGYGDTWDMKKEGDSL